MRSGCLLMLFAGCLVAACGQSDEKEAAALATQPPPARPHGVVQDCSAQIGGAFSDAYSDAGSIAVGPVALVGAAWTEPEVVRKFGGDKIAVLLQQDHEVTLEMPERMGEVASLGYGPLPENRELHARDGHRVVRFIACKGDERPQSTAGGAPITAWMGFVLADSNVCIPLKVWVDDEPQPREAAVPMGDRDCGERSDP